jgi:hypothetical protein
LLLAGAVHLPRPMNEQLPTRKDTGFSPAATVMVLYVSPESACR